MIEGELEMKTSESEENVRKSLNKLLEKAKTSGNSEDIHELRFQIDDYIEQGYNIRDYIHKYNKLVHEIWGDK